MKPEEIKERFERIRAIGDATEAMVLFGEFLDDLLKELGEEDE